MLEVFLMLSSMIPCSLFTVTPCVIMYTFLTANEIRNVNALVEKKEWGKLT